MRMPGVFPKLVMVFALLAGTACARSDSFVGPSENVAVIVADSGKHRFNVEIADEAEEVSLGLMHRTELAENAGMLFYFKDFEEPQPISMWMKNTLIPLDMAFIDADGVIVRIAANTTPRSLEPIPSGEPVMAVLEVNGGTFARLGIERGDRVRHPVFAKR